MELNVSSSNSELAIDGVTGGDAEELEASFASDPTVNASVNRTEAIDACKTNLDFLAAIILVDIFKYCYPPLFKAIWQMICQASTATLGKPKYALGIPRGFAKTILLKLYVVWLVLFSDRQFILIVCNTEMHAFNFLSDVAEMLSGRNIVNLFGDWRANMGDTDTKQIKKFSFRGRNIIIAAIGAGSSPRGLNINFVRPDIVIMDDMQNRDEAKNEDIAKEQMQWMLGTLMKACHPQRCVFMFVGNMYPFEGSILRKLKHSKSWISLITGAILADGDSIWPEHRTLNDLLEELATDEEQGHPEIFYAEVMNDEEAGTVSGIDVSRIATVPELLTPDFAQGGFIIIDPSLKKKKSDDTAIGAVLVFDGIPILWEVVSERLDPGQTIQQAMFLCMKYGMQLVTVESVAYQSSLIFWFDKTLRDLGIEGITVGEITTGGLQKNARIRDWLKKLLTGKNMIGNLCRSNVVYQITQWNPLSQTNKDDMLDIGAYMDEVMHIHAAHVPLMIQQVTTFEHAEAAHTADLNLAF
jgi:hypothetical protein